MFGGTELLVRSPAGRQLKVVVPHGSGPGSTIYIAEPDTENSTSPSAPSNTASPPTTVLYVTVPPNCWPGQLISVQTPNGTRECIIPEGRQPGQTFTISVPNTPVSPHSRADPMALLYADVDVVLSAMRQHSSDAEFQLHASKRLEHLACEDENQSKQRAMNQGVCQLLLQLLYTHHNVVDIVRNCLGAIRHLACSSKRNIREFVDAGAIVLIVEFMTMHAQVSIIQVWACDVLCAFAWMPETIPMIVTAGGVRAIFDFAIKIHGRDEDVLRTAGGALRNMKRDGDARAIISDNRSLIERCIADNAKNTHLRKTFVGLRC